MSRMRNANIITRDGTRLAVSEYGPRDAEHTVVAMHGLCLSQNSWRLHADNLASDSDTGSVRVITYDHRGHGGSAHAPIDTYTVRHLAADLSDILTWAGVTGPLTLAGHSMGGMAALQYMGLPASQRPVDPDSLLLVATAAGKLASRGVGTLLDLPLLHAVRSLMALVPERVADPLVRRATGPVVSAMVRHVGYTSDSRGVAANSAAWSVNRTALRTKVGFLSALASFDAYASLSGIPARTVILSGGKDFLTPRAHAEDIATRIPGARHLHFADRGHMLVDEAAESVSQSLRGFIAERGGAVAV